MARKKGLPPPGPHFHAPAAARGVSAWPERYHAKRWQYGRRLVVDRSGVVQTEERRRGRFARAEREGGSALLAVLVLGLVLSLVAGLGLHLAVSEIRLNRAFCDGVRAYYLAESGLVYGLAQARARLEQGQEPPFQLEGSVDNPFPIYDAPHGFRYTAVVEEAKARTQEEGGRGPAEPPAQPPGQEKKSTGEPGGPQEGSRPAPEAAGGTGGGGGSDSKEKEKKCRLLLTAHGWYGPEDDPAATRRMEARVTVTAERDGKYHWNVEYWRQVAPEA